MRGTILIAVHKNSFSIYYEAGRYDSDLYFTDEETETQRGYAVYLRSHGSRWLGQDLTLG